MNEIKKHCDTCKYSYMGKEKLPAAERGPDMRQLCRNAVYNSPAYTQEMLMEDWGKGHCRLWTPGTRKGNLS